MHYKIGTRGSKLAMAQARLVAARLKEAYPEDSFELVPVKTTGDKNPSKPLESLGAKGIFTDEIEAMLLSGELSLAVHSMKDMPEELAEGLVFADAWKREDPRDVLILKGASGLKELPPQAVIGTGSKRRAFQLKELRPDIDTVGIRGNVDTRIRKLMAPGLDAEGNPEVPMDGIVLAAAGVLRLGRGDEITSYFPPGEMIPAPTQGTLAVELRAGDRELLTKVNALSDPETQLAVRLERGFLKAIGGDCHLPIGAYFDPRGSFYALFGNEDGSRLAKTVIECGKDAYDGDTDRVIGEAVEALMRKL